MPQPRPLRCVAKSEMNVACILARCAHAAGIPVLGQPQGLCRRRWPNPVEGDQRFSLGTFGGVGHLRAAATAAAVNLMITVTVIVITDVAHAANRPSSSSPP